MIPGDPTFFDAFPTLTPVDWESVSPDILTFALTYLRAGCPSFEAASFAKSRSKETPPSSSSALPPTVSVAPRPPLSVGVSSSPLLNPLVSPPQTPTPPRMYPPHTPAIVTERRPPSLASEMHPRGDAVQAIGRYAASFHSETDEDRKTLIPGWCELKTPFDSSAPYIRRNTVNSAWAEAESSTPPQWKDLCRLPSRYCDPRNVSLETRASNEIEVHAYRSIALMVSWGLHAPSPSSTHPNSPV